MINDNNTLTNDNNNITNDNDFRSFLNSIENSFLPIRGKMGNVAMRVMWPLGVSHKL